MFWQSLVLGMVAQWQCREARIPHIREYKSLSEIEIQDMVKKYPELASKFESMDLEYQRYVQEVSSVLLSDPEMMNKLDSSDNTDFLLGHVAEDLNNLKPELRSKLNEIKRVELNRLLEEHRKLVKVTGKELENDIMHLDVDNKDTFEVKDLRYLLRTTVNDLNKIDQMRRQAFFAYECKKGDEMEKKFNNSSFEEKKKFLLEVGMKEDTKIHREKEVLHPGSEQQLIDVWENTDHMKDQSFNPATFFHLHDINGDGVWDENEVGALFSREVEKLFKKSDADYDMIERDEERELMRELYFSEADINKDRLITIKEFTTHLREKKYLTTPGWKLQNKSGFSSAYFKLLVKLLETSEELEKIKRSSTAETSEIRHIEM